MGKKLTVYMIDGSEFGSRYAEIGNWVGKAFYTTRAQLSSMLVRDEFNNPGVYCLKSKPNSLSFTERIYIGEAENIRERIKIHLKDSNRDFDELIFFISKDELLTKTQIKYLEASLIKLAREANASELENTQLPSFPTLHEADVSDMEYFFEQMKLIFPVMGYTFLKPITLIRQQREETANSENGHLNNVYKNKSGQVHATMYKTDNGFIIAKGSQANKQLAPSISDTYKRLQKKLIDSGVLLDKGEFYEFLDDTIFSSPSAASNIVLGRQSAGPIEWINDKGQTFKEVEGY